MKYAKETIWGGGCVAFLVSGAVAVMDADASQAFVSGIMFAACGLALIESILDRFVASDA